MTTSLNAHRLLKSYLALAAENYAGAPQAFTELADLAMSCLPMVTTEQRLPAMVLQNVFDSLGREQDGWMCVSDTDRPVTPELHNALLVALKFVVSGGSHARCIAVSEQLIRAASASHKRES